MGSSEGPITEQERGVDTRAAGKEGATATREECVRAHCSPV